MFGLGSLVGLGGGLLGGLLGGGGRRQPMTPAELARLFGPQALSRDYQSLYSLLASSPGAQSTLAMLNLAGQQASQDAAARYSGFGAGSGLGALGASLAGASSAFGRAQYQGQLSQSALEAAQQNLANRLSAYSGYQQTRVGQPSGFERIFGSILGAGGPALAAYFGRQNQNPMDWLFKRGETYPGGPGIGPTP